MYGTCHLCCAQAELKDGHIVPRWCYRFACNSTPPGERPVPIVRSNGSTAVYDQHQTTDYLLCAGCEQRLSHWEGTVARIAPQLDDSFPALDQLLPQVRLSSDVSINVDGASFFPALGLFALSVFWRASVSSACPQIDLGTTLDEELRQYLFGVRLTLPRVSLRIQILKPQVQSPALHRGFFLPEDDGAARTGFHFGVPGFYFSLLAGPRTSRWVSVNGFLSVFDPHCFLRTKQVQLGPSADLLTELIRHTQSVPQDGLVRLFDRKRRS